MGSVTPPPLPPLATPLSIYYQTTQYILLDKYELAIPFAEHNFGLLGRIVFVIVDLHLRTKADFYSSIQCSFVKIQDLIGYVSEYMLMRPIKQFSCADYLL
jgi:hypothetical protein